jgi:hypothetical protein
MDKEEIISFLEKWLRILVTLFYNWISSDGEVLGHILAVVHVLFATALGISIVFAHTIYPCWEFQIITFVCLFFVWAQHIFLKVCIFTAAELKLTISHSPSTNYLSKLFSSIFGTTLDNALTNLVLAETIIVGCYALELLSKLSIYLYSLHGIHIF